MSAETRRRRGPQWLSLLAIANLALLVLLWLTERFVGERTWVTALLTYAPQHPFGVPTLLLLFWALLRRRTGALVLSIGAGIFFVFALLGLNAPLRLGPSPAGMPLRVMTFNIHHGSAGANRIAAAIARANPDIVCLQETTPFGPWPDPMPPLRRLLQGWHLATEGEVATFTRGPIRSHRAYRSSPVTERVFLETLVEAQGRPVTVLNVHFATAAHPHFLVEQPHSVPEKVRHTAAVRGAQVEALLRIADSVRTPLVAMGDFNTPPRGLLYARLARRFRDAFRAAGWGLGYTYRADLPALRIDYIWAGGGIHVADCRVPKDRASDHRPVVATLVVSQRPPAPAAAALRAAGPCLGRRGGPPSSAFSACPPPIALAIRMASAGSPLP